MAPSFAGIRQTVSHFRSRLVGRDFGTFKKLNPLGGSPPRAWGRRTRPPPPRRPTCVGKTNAATAASSPFRVHPHVRGKDVPVPNSESGFDWAAHREVFRNKVLDAIARKTCMTDLREHIEIERVITPLDWQQEYCIYKGATFDLSHRLTQMLYLRPRNRFEELDNCYLVGGGTHPGSGLPTIYESGRISSNLICAKHGAPFARPTVLSLKRTVEE